MCFGVASYLICSDKHLLGQTGYFQYILGGAAISVPALLWLTAQSLFVDEYRFGLWHFLLPLTLVAVGFFNALSSDFFVGTLFAMPDYGLLEFTRPAQQFMNICFGVSAFYVAYQGRGDDLVDARRRFRVYFITLGSLIATALALTELFLSPSDAAEFHRWIGPPIILGAGSLFGFWMLSSIGTSVLVDPSINGPFDPDTHVEPADQFTYRRLVDAFEGQRLYREHGLSIAGLADRLDVPEHHLRRLINKELGFRNFAAFLSSYRLRDVVAAFSDPDQARTPILTIAFDAGFQSITTFNRTFRHVYGSTPTVFRKNVENNLSES